jgi:hypothetical protein
LRGAVDGRVVVQVDGGVLVLDLDRPRHPEAQAFVPSTRYPTSFLYDGARFLIPGGFRGVSSIGRDEVRLAP